MTRTESDSLGQITLPAAALYGSNTARGLENFPSEICAIITRNG